MKLTPEELQAIADDTQNLAPSTFMKGRAKGPEVKLPTVQPAHGDPLNADKQAALKLLSGFSSDIIASSTLLAQYDLKAVAFAIEELHGPYSPLTLCDLHGPYSPLTLCDLSAVEVRSKETMDEVRDTLGRIVARANSGEDIFPRSVLIRLAQDALAKLNQPQ